MSVRIELADARIQFREAQDAYTEIRAQAEQRVIEATGGSKGLSTNAEDRARAITLALTADDDYMHAASRLRDAQARLDHAQAILDARRAEDRASRDRASAAIERLAEMQGPSVPLAVAGEIVHTV